MKKVFIFEDDPSISRLYSQAFKLSGYESKVFFSGEDAENKLLTAKPDVILLDIMMPKVNGFEVLEKIKANILLKDIPVMVLTNLSSLPGGEADLEKARSMGAVDVIIKSQTDPKDVVAKAEAAFKNR